MRYHAYRLLYRPPSTFTVPTGWTLLEKPPDAYHINRPDLPFSKHRFGVVGYERQLSADEVEKWELEYLGPRDAPKWA